MADRPTIAFLIRHPAHFIALGFGAGLAPVAPGTFGTLLAIPLALLLRAAGIKGWRRQIEIHGRARSPLRAVHVLPPAACTGVPALP